MEELVVVVVCEDLSMNLFEVREGGGGGDEVGEVGLVPTECGGGG